MSGIELAAPPARGLAGTLFTPVQRRVLGLLFGQPARRFQSAEIIRLAASGTGAVHRLLQKLAAAGLVSVTREGNQKYYQANRDSPIFSELHGLVVKTIGVVEPLRAALGPLAERIAAAFVFGSVAKGNDRATSDLDLLVMADGLDYSDLYTALQAAEQEVARPINPTLMSRAEWRRKRAQPDSFAARVAAQPKLFVIGGEDDLGSDSGAGGGRSPGRGTPTTRRADKDIESIIMDGDIPERAMIATQRAVILEHRLRGLPLVLWRDGKVVEVPADSVELPEADPLFASAEP